MQNNIQAETYNFFYDIEFYNLFDLKMAEKINRG